MDKRFDYHEHMRDIAATDIAEVRDKDVSYGASWKKRGGVGAFMMLARKWDRLEEMVQTYGWDVINLALTDMSGKDGTVLAEIRDLRRYLLLLEAEVIHLDGKHAQKA